MKNQDEKRKMGINRRGILRVQIVITVIIEVLFLSVFLPGTLDVTSIVDAKAIPEMPASHIANSDAKVTVKASDAVKAQEFGISKQELPIEDYSVPDINVTPEHLDFECCESGPNTANKLSESEITPCGGNNAEEGTNVGIRDPAAVYCTEMGYEYKIERTEEGERGICRMPNKEECDAWAFYSGECGRAYSYCAKNGWLAVSKGETDCFATNCTTCMLPDGSCKTVCELLNLSEKSTVGVKKSSNANLNDGGKDGIEMDLPDHFDWQDKEGGDWMTPVKAQGSCGSCWAFSAAGVVEPQYNIFSGNPDLDLDLSEEYLVSDCSNAGACCGGWHDDALTFIKDSGITDEACLPYVDATDCTCYGGTCDTNCNYRTGSACSDATCSDRCSDWSSRLKSVDETGHVPEDIETIKDYLIEEGPLSVAMGIGSEFGGSFDGNGIYRCNNDSGVNHAVVIAGYDETEDYWIVKNSWGSCWNGNGYFKVGYGECAIENFVYYVTLTVKPEAEACFWGSPTAGCEPLTVEFNGSCSTGEIINYSWDFGDEETGSGMTLSHTYEAAGDYTVNLTVTVPCGSDMETKTNYIHVCPKEKQDLMINDMWVCRHDNCTICYNVTNIGNGSAPAGHNTSLYVDGIEKAYDHVDIALEPNASYISCFDYNWTYTPSKDNITVCADSNNTVEESNETNNCRTNIWMCGDVNCDKTVDMSDVIDLLYYVGYPGQYTICTEWAADVNCNKSIDMSDVIDLLYYVGYPGHYELNGCCKISG